MEQYLITHCAPTLASLKTGNLFCLPTDREERWEEQLERLNREFEEKGVRLLVLRRRAGKALIYVCRWSRLQRDLRKPGVLPLLQQCGYQSSEAHYALNRLRDRLHESDAFPHEIGLFLGYPLPDVLGFIQNGGKNCKYTGVWKVYENECEAIRLFAQFQKCREVYIRLYNQGRTVRQLTVAV